jgi:crotonobetainyl-CoA:carnitine CoA-transferase CaiB-like acyl-CoA transferase
MKVVDLSTDIAGRFAAKLFAMAGVEVLRPIAAELENDALSIYLDRGKHRVTAEGSDAFGALLADADLVFTSFDAGAFLGLAGDRAGLPSTAVEVTTSSFGMTGPYSDWRGGPLVDWASGGYLAITGEPGREPLMGPENLCAYVAGYAAAQGAEAALRARGRDGRGRHVDISTMDVMLGLHQSTFSRVSAGFVRERMGRYAEVYPLTVLPCREGYVSLGVVTDAEFDRLAIAFGLPDLVADERFATSNSRLANCDALDRELARFLDHHSAAAVVEALQESGVAATSVADPQEILANPQLAFRGFWAGADGVDGPAMPGNPIPEAKTFASAHPEKAVIASPPPDAKDLPLEGITVLDLTAFWAGPSATRCLADLGANVIWLERPRSRQDFDSEAPDPITLMYQLYHEKMNRHKRSIVLDLETREGREIAWQLAANADVVVENFRPGVAAKLGIGPAELCAAFPELVYVSLSGFGSAGPWGDWRSFGPNIEAASSILARTGYPGEGPMRLGHALPDGVGGLAGALAVLRGLRERDARGYGGWFDISQLEVYTALSGEDILEAAKHGSQFPRIGNRSRSGAVQGVFPCRGEDEWITIRLAGETDVARFAATTGIAGLVDAARSTPRDDAGLEASIGAYTRSHDKRDLAVLLQRAQIEAFPVLKPDEFASDAHVIARGSFVRSRRGGHDCILPASPLHCEPPLTNSVGAAPRFGGHTEEILTGLQRAPA